MIAGEMMETADTVEVEEEIIAVIFGEKYG